MKNESLTLVIPVYNEIETIETVLTGWHHSLKRWNIQHDIVVINDGSTDSTNEVLSELSTKWSFLHVYNQENAGHGAAIKYGYAIACSMENDFIFQTDSDHQFTPADFINLWEDRNEYQALFGIRENRQDPPLRKIITGLLQKIIFDIYNLDIPDANVPYRLFQKSSLKNLVAVLPTGAFAPNIFLSILSFKSQKIKTKSLPVKHFDRPHGDAKLMRFNLLKGCIRSFFEIFSFSYTLNDKLRFIEEKLVQDSYLSQEMSIKESQKQERHLKIA